MNFLRKKTLFSFLIDIALCTALFLCPLTTVRASATSQTSAELAEEQKLLPIQSNETEGWPQGPAVSARAAILMEADTGTILYAKNIHEHHYPASTTKILTAYIARQHSQMDETVTYSAEAINSIDWRDDSNIGIKIGESITMEQSLYGLLVGSGNECGNAIGEHISGSISAFVDLMNETAAQLGCEDSHFVTTNGKHDDDHYTSVYDLATIGRRFFADELLCKMSSTPDYVIPASSTLSRELIPFSKNKLLKGKSYAYEYLVGSKTGYTDIARQNLVSCAQKDGMKLICVVMSDESPFQFTDTIELFDYGFNNFKMVNAADYDTTYSVQGNHFFTTDNNIFGDSGPILSISKDARVVLPDGVSFAELDSSLDYDGASEGQVAAVRYSYRGQPLGSASILFHDSGNSFDFEAQPVIASAAAAESPETDAGTNTGAKNPALAGFSAPISLDQDHRIVFLNIRTIVAGIGIVAVITLLLLILRHALHNRRLQRRRWSVMKNHRSRKEEIIDFDRYTNHYE